MAGPIELVRAGRSGAGPGEGASHGGPDTLRSGGGAGVGQRRRRGRRQRERAPAAGAGRRRERVQHSGALADPGQVHPAGAGAGHAALGASTPRGRQPAHRDAGAAEQGPGGGSGQGPRSGGPQRPHHVARALQVPGEQQRRRGRQARPPTAPRGALGGRDAQRRRCARSRPQDRRLPPQESVSQETQGVEILSRACFYKRR